MKIKFHLVVELYKVTKIRKNSVVVMQNVPVLQSKYKYIQIVVSSEKEMSNPSNFYWKKVNMWYLELHFVWRHVELVPDREFSLKSAQNDWSKSENLWKSEKFGNLLVT